MSINFEANCSDQEGELPMKRPPFPNPSWWEKNESDNQEFFGYDNDDGTTSWYTPDGTFSDGNRIWNGTLIEL